MSLAYWTFWVAAAYVLYTYFGYPLLLAAWRKLRPAASPKPAARQNLRVSVILTVRNEVDSIRTKLRDLLAQDYPADLIEILVASDQSTDGTNRVVEEFAAIDPRVRLVAYNENIGKSVAINRTVPLCTGDILLLSDARQRVDPDAIRRLAEHFQDPRVGVVGAEMTLVDRSGSASNECTGLYWRYERSVRRLEAQLGLLTGVSGAFFAIRRAVFRDIPPGSYCEDVTLALYARDAGYRVQWEPAARVYEVMRDPYTEFRRKVRTLVGNYQLLSQFWPLYLPWRGRLAFTLISHKLCRLFIPLALLTLFVASAVLAPQHPFYTLAFLAQFGLYGAGCLGLARAAWRRSRLVNACGAFCMLNWAALVALVHVLRHGPRIQWK
jgi:cellulose synthase/poly-beta-1,6-N-acetylglucosamine synthase-like glycosyltransferase